MPVERGARDPGFGRDLRVRVPGLPQMGRVGQLVRIHHRRPPDPLALGRGHGSDVGGALEGVGAFHLPEQRQQHHRQLRHRIIRVGGVDFNRVPRLRTPTLNPPKFSAALIPGGPRG